MPRKLTHGFTLIELLVVIAIIGILSAIVLTQLNSARSKGADAKIKQELSSIIPKAQLLYDTTLSESYMSMCSNLQPNFLDASYSCSNGAAGWRASKALNGGGYWCVDYNATNKYCTTVPSGTSCTCT